MANNVATNTAPSSDWRLQGDFSATSLPGGDGKLANQVIETIREFGLQSQQLERIEKAMVEAMQRAAIRGKAHQPVTGIRVRIWVGSECICGRGWGFFLVEKPGKSPQKGPIETEYLVELFLYQERDS